MSSKVSWLRLLLGIAGLCLAACTLSAVPPTGTPPPTSIVIVATQSGVASNTPAPTITGFPPTSTVKPLATSTPVYTVSRPLPGVVCSVAPNASAVNIRSGPGTNFPIIGVLPASNWVLATRLDSSGWFQVSLTGTPVDGGWMSNTVVVLQQPCVCGPNNCSQVTTAVPTFTSVPVATATFPPDRCMAVPLTSTDSVQVFVEPIAQPGTWGRLEGAGALWVAGKTNDGWYGVYTSSSPVNIGIYRLSWIRADDRISLIGAPCGQLRVIDLSVPAAGDCMVTPANASSISIYGQTEVSAGVWGMLTAGTSLPVVGKSPAAGGGAPNGWYAVEAGNTLIAHAGKYRLRWIPIDSNVTTTGDCTNLPTVSLEF